MKPIHMIINSIAFFAVLFLSLISGCTDPDTAGATTETTNGITGYIRHKDNSAASNTIVKLLLYDHDPLADTSENPIYTDTTDSDGKFTFSRIRSGNYSILARNEANKTSTLIKSVNVLKDSLTELPFANLDKAGSILIDFKSQGAIDSGSYVYIPGTDIFAVTESGDQLVIDEVPSGSFTEVILVRAGENRLNILRDEIEIKPDTIVTIENPLWQFSREIILNTTASGADIKSDIYNFPILVRLNRSNFDFSQSQPGGKDLLFSGKNNKSLPLEIERWDETASQAEVWVKVDTIFGNSEQVITMYWGNPETVTQKTGKAVFDTADGFQSVWHLSETGDTVYDATANSCHGIRFGKLSRSSGVIGFGQIFDSSDAYFDMGNVFNPGDSNITLSAWVKRADTGLQAIIVKSNGSEPSSTYGWNLSFGLSNQLHFFTASADTIWGSSGSFDVWSDLNAPIIDTTTWHHIAVVFNRSDNEGSRCYIDGVDVTGGYRGDVTEITSIFNSLPLRIGSEADGDYKLTGSIDECVISKVIRPDVWIKLCFINQGANDRLVVFK